MHRFSLNLLDIDIDLDALAKNSMIPYIGINDDNFFPCSIREIPTRLSGIGTMSG